MIVEECISQALYLDWSCRAIAIAISTRIPYTMADLKPADRGTWSFPRILPFFFPVAFLYFLTPILNQTWSSWVLSQSDVHLGELSRAVLSEKSWLSSVQKRHEWMSDNKDYDSIL